MNNLDRRAFLAANALFAGGFHSCFAGQDPAGAQSTTARRSLSRSRISAITDEVALTEAAGFAFARQYSLDWIELRTVPGSDKLYADLDPATLRQFRKRAEDAGVGVSFLNTWIVKWTLPGTEPSIRARYSAEEWATRREADAVRLDQRMEHLKRAMEAAHVLGVEAIRVFTFWRTEDPLPLYPRIAEIIRPMAELAAREKLRLLIENESACNVATSEELRRMLAMLPEAAVGINWDPHNSIPFEPEPFPEGYRLLPKERLGNVQIKGESLLTPGEILDWRRIVDALLADGYTGHFGLETHFGEGEQRVRNAHASMKAILALVNG
ncbi:MAG: sugar phosphate isomerase/epimerase [Bryobacterales bacterium]|nr:sugar phosphate isomerase/epimerase [Bryobacterales bacterium]